MTTLVALLAVRCRGVRIAEDRSTKEPLIDYVSTIFFSYLDRSSAPIPSTPIPLARVV